MQRSGCPAFFSAGCCNYPKFVTRFLDMRLIFNSLILITSVFFVSCTGPPEQQAGKTVFRYNESSGITSLDPAFARDQANIWSANHLYNSLVQLDSNLNVQPCLAGRWRVSDDGKVYEFYTRSDVYFHDSEAFSGGEGRRMTARDAEYSLKRLLDADLASPGAWALAPVKIVAGAPAIRAVDDTTLVIELAEPFPPFLGMLSMQYCSVIPHEAVDFYGQDFRANPVGTGPFRFGMWKEGVKLVLLKNNKYFESQGNRRLPFLDAVAVTFIVDKQTAFLEFVKGNLDFMSGLDAAYKDEMLTPSGKLNPKYRGKINLLSQPYLNTEYLGILMDRENPLLKDNPLSDKRIRQAVSMGFDRNRLIRYLRNNTGTPGTHGFIPKGLPGFADSGLFGYDYNPEKAKQLLAEAGYPGGKGLPPITLSTNASYLDICQFIQNQLSAIGINMKIDVSPPATLKENIARSRVVFFRGSWIADYPDAENYLSLFYSRNFTPAGPNYTRFGNAQFDRLYQLASVENNDAKRTQYYRQMDSLVMEDAPVIVLFYDQVLRFVRSDISGLGSNPLNLLNLKTVQKNGN